MKYYLLNIETYNDGTKDSTAVYTFNTLDEAVAQFHSKMGVAMKNIKCASVMCMVVNSVGGVHKSEAWERATDTVEE